MELTPARRRSCLVVPASSPRKLEKAAQLTVDEVVIDLEDAVAPAAKTDARRAVGELLDGHRSPFGSVAVRINSRSTPWFDDDVALLASIPLRPLSVVLPKVEGPEDVQALAERLDEAEVGSGEAIRIQALIETAAGVARAGEAAAAGGRLESLILGYADLAASLGRSPALARDPRSWLAVQDVVLIAARSRGLEAIDGPWLGTAVDAPFRAAAEHARDLGFDGKWAIHPAQVTTLNELFTPAPAEVERAHAILAALEQAEREGQGAVALDGEMLDEAIAVAARRVLARAGQAA
jgi:citrate lyase subunit beta/citryl-CoA lyase